MDTTNNGGLNRHQCSRHVPTVLGQDRLLERGPSIYQVILRPRVVFRVRPSSVPAILENLGDEAHTSTTQP